MKKNKPFILLAVLLVILIGGAGFFYNKLSSSYKTDTLTKTSQTTENETESGEKNSEVESHTDSSENTDSGETTVETAPDFTMTDASGTEVKLSDFFGKPVVLNFWASWCGPCKSEMPHFEDAYQKYGEDINFVVVNLTDGARETVESASGFIEEQGYTFPVYFDTNTEGAVTYGTYSIPVTYFIGADGVPVAQANGALDAETLQTGIDMIQ